MAKDPYPFAPESDEADHGMVKLADEYAVWHEFTPDEARTFAHQMLDAADCAEQRDTPTIPTTEDPA